MKKILLYLPFVFLSAQAMVREIVDADRFCFSDDECYNRFFYCVTCKESISIGESGGLLLHQEQAHEGFFVGRDKEGNEIELCAGFHAITLLRCRDGRFARHADLMERVLATRAKKKQENKGSK